MSKDMNFFNKMFLVIISAAIGLSISGILVFAIAGVDQNMKTEDTQMPESLMITEKQGIAFAITIPDYKSRMIIPGHPCVQWDLETQCPNWWWRLWYYLLLGIRWEAI